MALSMDEQRVLAEIEKRLAAEEPGLAACLTNFRRPGPAAVLRSPRARIIGSLFTVLLVAMISLMVYAMIPFRAHTTRAPADKPGTFPSQTQISAVGPGSPRAVTKASSGAGASRDVTTGTSAPTAAGTGTSANTGSSGKAQTPGATSGAPASSGHAAATGQSQAAKAKTTGADTR
jgi:hypothetical protein